jgi:hypothetical protein
MKTVRNLLSVSLALALSASALVAKPLAGPKGGRILTEAAPHAEFFVDANRNVIVSFYDADLKPLAPDVQVVTATAETPSGKVKLEFAAKAGALVSTTPLPEGEGYRVVVQIRAAVGGKPANYRVDFHDEVCGECQRAEYACACEDHGGGEHGHGH